MDADVVGGSAEAILLKLPGVFNREARPRLGIEAGLAIVILAIILDRMCRVSTGAKS